MNLKRNRSAINSAITSQIDCMHHKVSAFYVVVIRSIEEHRIKIQKSKLNIQ